MNKIVLLLLILFAAPIRADSQWREIPLQLSNGDELSVEQYGESDKRVLWIPSEFSRHDKDERNLLESIADAGLQIWWLDLHGAYFLPPGRNSYEALSIEELASVIPQSIPDNGRLTLMATGRGSRVALQLVRQWQLDNPNSDKVVDMIMLHPNLSSGIARAGESLSLDAIAYGSNLSLYILQPSESAKRWYLPELREALVSGGSDVFVQLIDKVTDGFQIRDDATAYEREVRKSLPQMVSRARDLLSVYSEKKRSPVKLPAVAESKKSRELNGILQPIKAKPMAPALVLRDVEGKEHDLTEYRGRKVLINFWTTWCPPCVKEIPSLGRLQKQFDKQRMTVLSVDIGESKQLVEQFLAKVPAAFPVMLDPDGKTVKTWKIRAFPTTFLIDNAGRLRYGYFGALEWDAAEVVELIKAVE